LKNSIFAVCDLEPTYAYNFMEAINEKQNTPFEVQAFTNTKALAAFCKDNHVAVLLISNRAMEDSVKEMHIDKIIILSEEAVISELVDFPAIYKYQSSENIIAEVMDYYAQSAIDKKLATVSSRKVNIIGIYSPIKRSLKTSFAITLGQVLAKDKNVLYINLEEYAGLESLLGIKFLSDLSELMYFIRQKVSNIILKTNGIIQNIGNMDFIPPVSNPIDIRSITYEDLSWFLDELVEKTSYDVILLDFGEGVEGIFQLLELCNRIYMPVLKDTVSQAKLVQFDKILNSWGLVAISEKIKRLKLPYHRNFGAKEVYIEQLVWGELGDYVRNLVYEDKY